MRRLMGKIGSVNVVETDEITKDENICYLPKEKKIIDTTNLYFKKKGWLCKTKDYNHLLQVHLTMLECNKDFYEDADSKIKSFKWILDMIWLSQYLLERKHDLRFEEMILNLEHQLRDDWSLYSGILEAIKEVRMEHGRTEDSFY